MEGDGTWCTWVKGKCEHNNKPSCRAQAVVACRNKRDRNEAAEREAKAQKEVGRG